MKKICLSALLSLISILPLSSSASILGSALSEVTRQLGQADSACHLSVCYGGGKYGITLNESKVSEVYVISAKHEFSISRSRSMSLRFMPADSRLISTRTDDDETIVEIFNSRRLAKAFAAKSKVWAGSPVGTFTVMHVFGGRKTIVAVGEHD